MTVLISYMTQFYSFFGKVLGVHMLGIMNKYDIYAWILICDWSEVVIRITLIYQYDKLIHVTFHTALMNLGTYSTPGTSHFHRWSWQQGVCTNNCTNNATLTYTVEIFPTIHDWYLLSCKCDTWCASREFKTSNCYLNAITVITVYEI